MPEQEYASPMHSVHAVTSGRRLSRLSRRWLQFCVALLIVATALQLRYAWVALGDNALMQMWTDAVGGRGTPLVGGDARFGWNHLGPWAFYLLAIPYRLLGGSSRGLLVGAAAINITSLVVATRCIRATLSDRAAAIVTGGALVLMLTAQGTRLVDPWNPYIALMPYLLAVVSCWAVCCGQWRWLPWLLGAGSFCVQSHIVFGPPTAVLFAVAFVAIRRGPFEQTRRSISLAGIVALFAWLPPAIDMVLPHRHNVLRVGRFFTSDSPDGQAGLRAGLGVVLRETGLGASWLGSHPGLTWQRQAFDGGLGFGPGLGIVALAAAGVLAWRARNRRLCGLVAIVAALLAVGVVELASTRGDLYPYLFAWVGVVGMLCWMTLLVAIVELLRVPTITDSLRGGVVLVSLLVTIGTARSAHPRSPLERPQDAGIVAQLTRATTARLDPRRQYRIVHGFDSYNSIYEHGLAMQLIEHGFDVKVTSDLSVLFGWGLVDNRSANAPGLSVIAPFKGLASTNGILALNDPLTPAERLEEIRLTILLDAAYRAGGHLDAADVIEHDQDSSVELAGFLAPSDIRQPMLHRLAVLRGRGRPVAVVLIPAPNAAIGP